MAALGELLPRVVTPGQAEPRYLGELPAAHGPFPAYLGYAANFIRRELATACCPAQRWPESLYALSLR